MNLRQSDFRATLPLPKLFDRVPRVANAVRRFVVPDPAVDLYTSALDESGRLACGRLLDRLNIRYELRDGGLERIPRKGALVVVSNHPFGMLEGIVLGDLLLKVRPDVRILANHLLAALPGAGDPFLFVNPFGGPDAVVGNVRALREARRWLKNGGVVVVFPAGEVAHLNPGAHKPLEPKWNNGASLLLRHTGASALPIHFEGDNSFSFHLLGLLHPRLRTARLTAELLRKRGERVVLKIGTVIPAERLNRFPTDTERTLYLRWRTDLLAGSRPFALPWALPRRPVAEIAPSQPVEQMAREIANLPEECLLVSSGSFAVYSASAQQIPCVLREIGRLREITFRAAGEGTGRDLDIDRFDDHYCHLFLWDQQAQTVVGAYRLCSTSTISNPADLYTYSLFRYDRRFLARLGTALELGRSFVRIEYQRQYIPLLLLWKGIAAWVLRRPEHAVLFGPVSISRDYDERSRALITAALSATSKDGSSLVRPRNPYRKHLPKDWDSDLVRLAVSDPESLSEAIAEIEPDRKGIPILLKQYLKLGGIVLAFNVDSRFSGVLDGLIVVDLRRAPQAGPRTLHGRRTGPAVFGSSRAGHIEDSGQRSRSTYTSCLTSPASKFRETRFTNFRDGRRDFGNASRGA